MTSLDREFEKLQIKADMHMPAWDKLRKEAIMALNNK